jgi:hypothetical protein
MDNISSTFIVLTLELPDPTQELFAQTRHVATTFTCFTALPTKLLQWMIWRRAFHREKDATGHPIPTNSLLGVILVEVPVPIPRCSEVPVSLHVCKESRDETLRFYVILLQQLEFDFSNKVPDFSRDMLGAEVCRRRQWNFTSVTKFLSSAGNRDTLGAEVRIMKQLPKQ